MALKFTNTNETHKRGLKVLTYGDWGSGKTSLCRTLLEDYNPIIISAEGGTLSLADVSIPVIEVEDIEDVRGAYNYLLSEEGQEFDWVCLDSLTEIMEVLLVAEKKHSKDARQAYGAMKDDGLELVRYFRDLPRNVFMTALMDRVKDDKTGRFTMGVSMPGSQLGGKLPALFDEVFCLRVFEDEDGTPIRKLQTGKDEQYSAKDRSGTLELYEDADLGAIAKKILKGKQR